MQVLFQGFCCVACRVMLVSDVYGRWAGKAGQDDEGLVRFISRWSGRRLWRVVVLQSCLLYSIQGGREALSFVKKVASSSVDWTTLA